MPYRGNGASVIRIVPYAALHFMVYEQYRCWILNNCSSLGTGPFIDLLAGSAAGGTAVLCTYPLDLARAKLAYQVRFLDHGSLVSEWMCQLFITNIQITCHLYYLRWKPLGWLLLDILSQYLVIYIQIKL